MRKPIHVHFHSCQPKACKNCMKDFKKFWEYQTTFGITICYQRLQKTLRTILRSFKKNIQLYSLLQFANKDSKNTNDLKKLWEYPSYIHYCNLPPKASKNIMNDDKKFWEYPATFVITICHQCFKKSYKQSEEALRISSYVRYYNLPPMLQKILWTIWRSIENIKLCSILQFATKGFKKSYKWS